MPIRINGSTSGYIEIDAPAAAGNNTIVLPNGNGTSGQVLQTNGSGVLSWTAVSSFDSGTVMLFQQTTAPTGWTKQTTHDDKALRIVSGTVGSGGATAFSAVMNGSVDATTLTVAQMPSHVHNMRGNASSGTLNPSSSCANSSATMNTQAAGGGGSHTHSMNVAYVDVIMASKD